MSRFAVREALIEPAQRRALRDHAARIKHDLGKYVAFQARWLPDDPAPDELRAALQADLLSTRRGPEGSVDAGTVWAAFREPLVGTCPLDGHVFDLRGDPRFDRLDAAMREVEVFIDALRSDRSIDLRAARAAALRVADACSALLQTTREVG